ncbi:FMRFamide receptor-like [Biomphalaria glabrata]|uniref:FMRFamide receptor-like n=1 Tax=Biomphalaria glabrata TaxID=6526 RepID=A0A9W3BI25_BIOGL|nr:FMRFamide receptor-like [Biomphalaria glabrata]
MNSSRTIDIISNLTQKVSPASSDVSDDVYMVILFVTNIIIANILSLLGILGSILNIIILSYHKMQDTTNIVLLFISICDLIYSITQISFILSESAFFIHWYIYQWVFITNNLIFSRFNFLAVIASIHLVTLVSIERMVAICFPFHVSRVFTLFRMKCIIVGIVFCNIILQTPSFFSYEMYYIQYKNVTIPVLRYGDLYYRNFDFLNKYSIITSILFLTLLPFCVIFICTSLTIFNISMTSKTKASIFSKEAIAKRKKEMKSVKIVLIICVLILFLVLIPFFVQQILFTFALVQISKKQFKILFWIVNLLAQINSSFNFVIYVTSFSSERVVLLSSAICAPVFTARQHDALSCASIYQLQGSMLKAFK